MSETVWHIIPVALPERLELIRKIPVRDDPDNITELYGQVFASVDGGVDVIVNSTSEPFIQLDGWVYGLRAYKDNLYMIHENNIDSSHRLCVYDLTGIETSSWSVHKSAYYLTVHEDLIYVPERDTNRITVYTLTGQSVRHIPCNLTGSSNDPHICITPDNCVIVTTGSHVSCISIESGETVWTNDCLDTPHAVTTDAAGRIYVAKGEDNKDIKMWVLRSDTGEVVKELLVTDIGSRSWVFDLHITADDTEIYIPRWEEDTVHHYKLVIDVD